MGDITVITLSFSRRLTAKMHMFSTLLSWLHNGIPVSFTVCSGVKQWSSTLSLTEMAFDPVSKDPSDDKFLDLNTDRKERYIIGGCS